MKPIVLQAQIKELLKYIKEIDTLDTKNLVQINKKLLKIHGEVAELLEKIS
jgi:ribosomal protein S15P/S13E